MLLNDIEKRFWQIVDQPNLDPELIIKKFIQLSQLVGITSDSDRIIQELKQISHKINLSPDITDKERVLYISHFLFEEEKFQVDTTDDIRGLFIERTLTEKKGHPLCISLIFQLLCYWQRCPVDIIKLGPKLLIKPQFKETQLTYIDFSSTFNYLNEEKLLNLLNQCKKEEYPIETLDFSQLFLLALDIFENHFENKKLFKLLLLTLEIKNQVQPSNIPTLQKKIRLNYNLSRLPEVQKDLKKLSFISEFNQWPLDLQKTYLEQQKPTDLSH